LTGPGNGWQTRKMERATKKRRLIDEAIKDSSDHEDPSSDLDDSPSNDAYELHYSDAISDSLHHKIALLEAGKYKTKRGEAPVVGMTIASSLFESREAVGIKKRLADVWNARTKKDSNGALFDVTVSALQADLLQPLATYKDVLYGDYTTKQSAEIGELLALHTLNHVYKTRDKVVRNSDRLKKAAMLNEPTPYVVS